VVVQVAIRNLGSSYTLISCFTIFLPCCVAYIFSSLGSQISLVGRLQS